MDGSDDRIDAGVDTDNLLCSLGNSVGRPALDLSSVVIPLLLSYK